MFKKTAIAAAFALCAAHSAMAVNFPTQVYEASYTMTAADGKKLDMHMASDGKGHFMTEQTTGGQKFSTIIDYPKGISTTVMHKQKMAMKTKFSDPGYAYDEGAIKKMGGKSLGSKTINGHPCHGYEYSNKGVKTESWIGDDCKLVVHSVTDHSGGKSIMDLKSVDANPSPDLFKVPDGYKMMN